MSALHVSPDALLGRPLDLRLTGAPPGAAVTISAETTDAEGRLWRTERLFTADAGGGVDPAVQPAGGEREPDASALIWGLSRVEQGPAEASGEPTLFIGPAEGYAVEFRAFVGGELVAVARSFRRILGTGVRREEVRQGGLNGVLFTLDPEMGPLRGAVLAVGGSEGGHDELRAGLLASEGFLVLSLAYFGAPGRPRSLVNIPLEDFRAGLAFLKARPEVGGRPTGLTGVSKGGEAALLVAATWPQEVGAVVAVVGSGVVYEGIGYEAMPDGERSSWSLDGQPLPYIPYGDVDWRALYSSGEPVRLTPLHRMALERASAEEREVAAIRTERFGGPLLLISGGDDQMWPSALLSDLVCQRRAAAGRPTEHLTHKQAGHRLGLPGLPGIRAASLGGQPWADAQVQQQGWARTVAMLSSVWEQEKE